MNLTCPWGLQFIIWWHYTGRSTVCSKFFSVLYIEDEPIWSGLVVAVLADLPGVRAAVAAATGAEGLVHARACRTEVVLLDLRLPDVDGLILADRLAALPHRPRIVLFSARSDEAALHAASRPHLAGMIGKSLQASRLLPRMLEEVTAGRRFFSPDVRTALQELKGKPDAFFKILSPRELEFAAAFGRGLGDEAVAAELGVGVFAARSQRQRIMQKLGLHRSPELIHWAIRTGLVDPVRPPLLRAETGR